MRFFLQLALENETLGTFSEEGQKFIRLFEICRLFLYQDDNLPKSKFFACIFIYSNAGEVLTKIVFPFR